MNQAITVGGESLAIKEYKGRRVVTLGDVDRVHQRPVGTARKRFNDNRKRFVEGVDCFVQNPDEAKMEFDIIAPRGLVLLTESGYLMLVKSLTDDKAWEVQRMLITCYFHAKEQNIEPQEPQRSDAYVFHPKLWNGKQVVTLWDVAYLTGVPRDAVHNAFRRGRRYMREGDGWLLGGDELRTLQRQTHDPKLKCAPRIWVLTEQGCRNVLRLHDGSEMMLWQNHTALSQPGIEKRPTETRRVGIEWADMESSAEAQACLKQIRQAMQGLEIMLESYNLHYAAKQFPEVQGAIVQLANCVFMKCNHLSGIPIQTIVGT